MVEFSAKQFSDQAHECIPYVKLTVAGIKISSIRVWSPGDERPSICKSLNMIMVLHKNPGTRGIKSHAFDSKKVRS